MTLKSLSFQLFGAPQVLRNGQSMHGKATQRRRLALLALLASAPSRVLSRDRLIGMIWPERDAAQARKLLSESLYVMRREFGDELLDTSNGDMIALNEAAVEVDLWQFAAALESGDFETAASISDAPFLDGVFLDEAEEFERWLDGERGRIARERERALRRLAAAAEGESRWRDAAHSWLRLLHDEPLSSQFVLSAAKALAAGGEVPTALQTIATFEERLRRELDVAPEPEVLELAQRLRAGRPALSPRVARSTGESDNFSGSAAKLPDAEIAAAPESAAHDEFHAAPPPKTAHSNTRRWLAAAAIVLFAVALAWWFSDKPKEESLYDPQRLAVLYFRDGSAGHDLGPVADLLTEAVIEQLAGSPAFEVVPVSGVRPFRDGTISLDSIARALRVGYVIDGSVYRTGQRLNVRVRLIDAASDAVLTSGSLERSENELLELEDDVARDIAVAIRQRLGRDVRLARMQRASTNVRAWNLVARGNREREDASLLTARRSSADSAAALRALHRADSLYVKAREADPAWARPTIERGWTALTSSMWFDGAARIQSLETAIKELTALHERHANDPEVLEVLGALRWLRIKTLPAPFDVSEISLVVRDLESAVERRPDLARAWVILSNIHLMRGEVDRAGIAGRRALDADAYIEDAPIIYRNLMAAYIYRGQPDSASVWCTRGRREQPSDWWFTECELTIMKYDLASRPNPDSAWQLVRILDSLDSPVQAGSAGRRYAPVYRRMIAAAVSARAGDTLRARAELERQRAAATDSLMQIDLIPEEITLLLQFGDRAAAVDRLRWAIERRPLLAGLLAHDPILRELAPQVLPSDASNRGTAVPIPR